VLEPIELPSSIIDLPIPHHVTAQIDAALSRIQTFQDRWDRPQIEQFVAADYFHVYQCLQWIKTTQPAIGSRFLEWGCGFAVVSAIADALGWDAVGIEAERELLAAGLQTMQHWPSNAQLIHGNFLPPGSESLAADPTFPSVGHPIDSGYEKLGLDLDDFSLVYAYPWPGEETFHEAVFDRHAARGGLLLIFAGPNDLRLYRKLSESSHRRHR
jgi:hypothetical protein